MKIKKAFIIMTSMSVVTFATLIYMLISIVFNYGLKELGFIDSLSVKPFVIAESMNTSLFDMEKCLSKSKEELCENQSDFLTTLDSGLNDEWNINLSRYKNIETELGLFMPLFMRMEQINLHNNLQAPISRAFDVLDKKPKKSNVSLEVLTSSYFKSLGQTIAIFIATTSVALFTILYFVCYRGKQDTSVTVQEVKVMRRTYQKIFSGLFILSSLAVVTYFLYFDYLLQR